MTEIEQLEAQLAAAQRRGDEAERERDEAIAEHGKESGFWGRACANTLERRTQDKLKWQAERDRLRATRGKGERRETHSNATQTA